MKINYKIRDRKLKKIFRKKIFFLHILKVQFILYTVLKTIFKKIEIKKVITIWILFLDPSACPAILQAQGLKASI